MTTLLEPHSVATPTASNDPSAELSPEQAFAEVARRYQQAEPAAPQHTTPPNYDKEFAQARAIYRLRERQKSQAVLRRSFDIAFSLMALVLGAPLFLLIALGLKVMSPDGPVVFAQQRLGRNGRLFNCYKFRTMVPNAEAKLQALLATDEALREEFMTDFKLKNDPRIVPGIGHFLRKSSLDELPQFWNVLKGDMSVVGPRPIVLKEASKYAHYIRHLFVVKPGLTGLWQVSGRNDVTYRRRIAMDLLYIRKHYFLQDLWIVWMTVVTMFKKQGAY